MGVLEEGGSGRKEAVDKLINELGGELETFYFAYGEDDTVIIVDLPDNTTAVTVAMTVEASGAADIKTTTLLEPEEIDEAARRSVHYRPPGD
jgi:uncharacterized protein with GYD domain